MSVIGTGRMGKGLVKALSAHGWEVSWGSRSYEKAAGLIDELALDGVKPVAIEEALEADLIFPALWFRDLLPWAQEHQEQLAGKILVDIVNPFTEDFSDFTTDWGTSAAEELQKIIPETSVIGAFKNTFFAVFENPVHDGVTSDVYVTGDKEEAKKAVMDVLMRLPFRILDGGKLKNNRTIERMTLFEREVSMRYGNYPYVSFHLFGLRKEL